MGRYHTSGYESDPDGRGDVHNRMPPRPRGPREDGPTDRGRRRQHEPQAVRVALWGASSGGKTTYLGALSVAATELPAQRGTWTVWGLEQADTKFLNDEFDRLVNTRKFPPATQVEVYRSIRVHGDFKDLPAQGARRFLGPLRPRDEVDLILDVQDPPGDAFQKGNTLAEAAIKHIEGAQGIIFLLDPARVMDEDTARHDEDARRTVEFLQSPLMELMRRHDANGTLVSGRLPHHIAICLTKFDEESVFRLALDHQRVSIGRRGPFVPESQAEEFVEWFCDLHPNRGASMALNLLRRHFIPDRTKFFVISSIGFYLNRSGNFDMHDHANTILVEGTRRIRGDIHPINVLEPLIHLEHKIRTGKR